MNTNYGDPSPTEPLTGMGAMLVPDIMLAVQFFPERRFSPEQKMLLALVEGALRDAIKHLEGRKSHVFFQAKQWIMCDDEEPWSFAWCCRELGRGPEQVVAFLTNFKPGEHHRRMPRRSPVIRGA